MSAGPDPLASLSPAQRAALELLLRRRRGEAARDTALPRRADPAGHPLSFAQQRLWLLDQLSPGDPAYNIHGAVRLCGALDPVVLGRALAAIAARHEPLRARFVAVDGAVEQLVAPAGEADLPRIDLSALPATRRETELLRLAGEEARRRFDLARGPLLRTTLVQAAADDRVLLLTVHHIAADGWSISVLLRELTLLYAAFAAGRASPLPPLPCSYADYAAWQRERLSGERLAREVEHWRRRLDGLPELRWAPEAALEAVGSRGGTVPFGLSADETARLQACARAAGVSLFVALLAAFQALLARWIGARDLAVGAPVAHRLVPEVEGLIGFFVNTLVLRADLSGDPSFGALLARSEQTVVEALAHQELPFEKLVEELHPERRLGRTPFVSAVLALQNLPPAAAALPGLEMRRLPVRNGTARFDLTLSLAEEEGRLTGDLEFRRGLLPADAVARLAGHLRVLLQAAVDDPARPLSALPLLTEPERHQLLTEWAGPEESLAPVSLTALFRRQALATPTATAVVCAGESITYGELERRANQLARRLRALGAGVETVVAVCVERSLAMVVGLLGILKSGAAYLPVDPRNPRERQEFLLADGGAAILVTQDPPALELPGVPTVRLGAGWQAIAGEDGAPPPEPAVGDRALAVLYTSGSTGRPKATLLGERGLLNLCLWFRAVCPIDAATRALLGFSFSFDAAFKNVLVPLLAGGRTVLAPPGPYDAAEWLETIRRERITFLNTTPSQMLPVLERAAAAGWESLASLRTLILGGEAPRWEALQPWLDSGACRAEILHMYGPSEASDTVTCHRVTRAEIVAGGRLPVGRAADNTGLRVVDPDLVPLPIGRAGELCLAGIGLARGYAGRPELTAERFLPDPWGCGARMYRTGDLARLRPDGTLEILGRLDHQIKIRGIRIEPSEVERALTTIPGVGGALVAAREDAAGDRRLVAWLVPREGEAPESIPPDAALRAALGERLPDAMVPARFVRLERFPVTPRGKIDRAALPDPAAGGEEPETAAPVDALEQGLCDLFREVLAAGRVDPAADFFALGGHSMSAFRLATRIQDRFGLRFAVRDLFAAPTPAGLAALLRGRERETSGLPPIRRVARDRPLPVSLAQHRLWLLHQLAPESTAYHLPAALHLRGRLAPAALFGALGEIVRRQEALRTRFPERDGEPVQEILPPAATVPAVADVSGLGDRGEEAARAAVRALAGRPFDLARRPPVRLLLLRLGPEEHVLALVVHHLVSDGWSTAVFLRELAALYDAALRGAPSPLAEPPVQGVDHAVWQREALTGSVVEEHLRWWRARLAGAPRRLDLPTDRPRPPRETAAGAGVPVRLDAPLVARLRRLALGEEATLFIAVVAALQVVLGRWAGQEMVSVGTPVARRNRLELEGLIGFYVHTVVLCTDLAGDPTGRELLARVRDAAFGAFAHQDLPFERLVAEFDAHREPGRSPLFQVSCALQNAPHEVPRLRGLEVELPDADPGTTQYDLAASLRETGDGAAGSLRYRTALFFAPTVRRLAGHWEVLLRGLAAEPDRPLSSLPLLAEPERHQVVAEWSRPAAGPAGEETETFPALFEAQVDRTPEAPAVVAAGRVLTYRELDRRANRIAARLLRRGVRAEARVLLRLERTPDLLAALVGVWKAGGVAVPLAPDAPPERLAALRAAAAAVTELSDDDLAVADLEEEDAGRPGVAILPEQLAYILSTSGSSGTPKGVMIPHRAPAAFHRAFLEAIGRTGERPLRIGMNAPLVFDASLQAVVTLLQGHCVWIVPEEARRDPEPLAAFLTAADLDVLDTTPSHLDLVLAACAASGHPPRELWVGGEAIPPPLWQVLARLPGTRCWNVYGPTEATVNVTARRITSTGADEAPDLGRPLPGVTLHLLDAAGGPAPIGVTGEVCLGGAQVGRGYQDRPDLTAERFRPDPLAETPGARLYHTGDLARRRPSGAIELLGRADGQVKIRGQRIEPGEIEAHLLALPEVREAVVGVREGAPGDRHLVAWIAAAPDLDLRALRAALARRLPEALLPAVFVRLDRLPRLPNGKLDRRSLPEPVAVEEAAPSPADAVERELCDLFREVLGAGRVDPGADFFALGGHSLSAFRLTTRLRGRFGLPLAVPDLFAAPTPSRLAAVLRGRQQEASRLPPIRRVPRGGPLPLTLAQRRLWLVHQIAPDSAAYHLPAALRLCGRLDVGALHGALCEIVRRHEALRTRFPAPGGEPVQEILPAGPVALPVVDLAACGESGEAALREAVRSWAVRPFDPAREPPVRFLLLRRGAEEHVFAVVVHHLVSDGWSTAIFLRELEALYEAAVGGRPSPLAELRVQGVDWAVWQREQLTDEEMEEHLRWWKDRLAGAPRRLALPTDRPRPPRDTPAGADVPLHLGVPPVEALRRLAQGEEATLYIALLAGFQAVLSRWTGQETVCIGTPVAGRSHLELEGLIGFFVHTAVVCTDLAGEPTGRELLGRVREAAFGAFAHQELPFERLVEAFDPHREQGWSPLFQASFALHNAPRTAPRLPGLTVEPEDVDPGTAQLDLTAALVETADGAAGALRYRTALFHAATMRRLAGHWETLLQGLAAEPDRPLSSLPLLAEAERHQVLSEWSGGSEAGEALETFPLLWEAQVDRAPDAFAVIAAGRTLTFRELDRRANRIAGKLRRLGVAGESRVLLRLERTTDLLAALLGIWKAGGTAVPVAPDAPAERLAALRTAVAPVAELAAGDLEGLEGEGEERPPRTILPAQLAYVLHTSGSTGAPKGVMISHRALAAFHRAFAETVGLAVPPLRIGWNAPLVFDASLQAVVALLEGHCLWIVPEEARRDPEALAGFLAAADLDALDVTPAQLDLVLAAGEASGRLPRQLWVGGEAIPSPLWHRLAALPRTRCWNVYGPTECTVDVLGRPIDRSGLGEGPDLGRPIPGVRVLLLDAAGRAVPVGAIGEICLGGPQTGRGYLERPDLTAERFRPDPFATAPGARLYRTGDLARWRPDGRIDLLGRVDGQMKIRGVRVEPGEIEAALAAHPAVGGALVAARAGGEGEKRLIAWLVPAPGAVLPPPSALREHLRERLPEGLIPAAFVPLTAFPRNTRGKIDREALPEPEAAETGEASFVAPRDAVEQRLADLFREILGGGAVGIHDSFFDRGGHSLSAARLAGRVREALGVTLPVAALFAAPTVEDLARLLQAEGEITVPTLVVLRAGGEGAPLFLVHPGGGTVFAYIELVRRLPPGFPVYGLQAPGVDPGEEPPTTVDALVTHHLEQIRRVQPAGARPVHLAGWSFGGLVAFELARRLREEGDDVASCTLIDPTDPADLPALAWEPGAYDGPLDLLEAAERPAPALTWRARARRTRVLPGNHDSLLVAPGVEMVAEVVGSRVRHPRPQNPLATAGA